MDISKLDVITLSNEGYKCVIVNPKTGKDTDIVITVKGVFAGNFRDESEQADTIEKTASLLARYTIGWENLEENGKAIPFSQEEAERVFAKYPIIRGQVLNAALDMKNFIQD